MNRRLYGCRIRRLLFAALLTAAIAGCSLFDSGSGTLRLSLTDAPIDAADVEGVFITIDSIEYNQNGTWVEDTGFAGPKTFNLLELTGGEVSLLSETIIDAGEVSQIRFHPPESTKKDRIGSVSYANYIAIDPDGTADGDPSDDELYELKTPSMDQTGYKAVGAFTVPANGSVEITADFDVRKSVGLTGEGSYILKPTIRLIVNHQAGTISGDLTGAGMHAAYMLFVYENGTYDDSESSADFSGAVTSGAPIDTDEDAIPESYILPFLASGTYDIIAAAVGIDGSYTFLDAYQDISVTAGEVTDAEIILPAED